MPLSTFTGGGYLPAVMLGLGLELGLGLGLGSGLRLGSSWLGFGSAGLR